MTTKTKPKTSELDEYFPDAEHVHADDTVDWEGKDERNTPGYVIDDLDAQLEVFSTELEGVLDELLPNATPQKRKAVKVGAWGTAEYAVLFEKNDATYYIGKLNSFVANVEKKAIETANPDAKAITDKLNERHNRITGDAPLQESASANGATEPDKKTVKAFGVELANAAFKRTGDKKTVKAFVKASCGSDVLLDLYMQNDNPKFWIAKIFGYRDPAVNNALGERAKYTAKVKGGAEYYKATGRILEFRAKFPEQRATISTELVQFSSDVAVFKAMIIVDGQLVATAHAMCTPEGAEKAQGRYLEMAETNAVARALGYFGFGTNLLDKDDGPHYMADSPVKSNGVEKTE